MMQRVPRKPRRSPRPLMTPPPEPPVPPPVAVDAQALNQAVDRLAELCVSLRVPMAPLTPVAPTRVVVDQDAWAAASYLVEPLAADAALAAASGVSAGALQENADQLEVMTEIAECYDQASERADLSLRRLVVTQRQAMLRVDAALQALIADPNTPPELRAELRMEQRLIERCRREPTERRLAQAQRTIRQRRAREAAAKRE